MKKTCMALAVLSLSVLGACSTLGDSRIAGEHVAPAGSAAVQNENSLDEDPATPWGYRSYSFGP